MHCTPTQMPSNKCLPRMASELELAQIPTAAGNRILVAQKRKKKKG